jgi:chemotaxis protein methyltransferase CheR
MTTNHETEEFWEGHYRKSERVWSGKVNAVFAATVEPLAPGRALDLGCGEGADAVWLARRGWQVDAVDVSPTALARAAQHAEEAEVAQQIAFHRIDLAADFPEGRFDLVSAQFLQSPIEFPRDRVLRRSWSAVAPGGVLLVVEHAAAPPWSGLAHAEHAHFSTPQQTLAALGLAEGEGQVERAETVERPVTAPDGTPAVLLDGVLVVRRPGRD